MDSEDNSIILETEEIAVVSEPNLDLSLHRPFWKIKRAFDFVIAFTVAIVLSPVILIILALVLLDVGVPAIFWQQRVGRNGAPLHLYKYRTLKTLFDRQTT